MKKIKKTEKINEKKLHILSLVSFLFGFAQALLLYVTSDYFSISLNNENVSSFYFIAYIIALVSLLNMHKIIKMLGKSRTFFLFFFFQMCILTGLIFIKPSFLGIIFLIFYIVADYLTWVVLDVIIEGYSEDKKSGRIRGFHLMILSAGVMAGPFLSTRILSSFDFQGLFIATLILNSIMFIVTLISFGNENGKFRGNLTIKDIGLKIFTNKNVLNIYLVSLCLEAFFALMIVYTPLYLLNNMNLSWQNIGIIFTIMLLPFVLLEYPVGSLADKYFGEKEMIIAGLIIMFISSVAIFFIKTNSIFIWSIALLMTRVGAAMVEILRDSYFYKKIDGRDVDLISFFRTTRSVAYLFATGFSAMLLIIAPMKYIFILIAIIVFIGLYPAIKLIDNKSELEIQ